MIFGGFWAQVGRQVGAKLAPKSGKFGSQDDVKKMIKEIHAGVRRQGGILAPKNIPNTGAPRAGLASWHTKPWRHSLSGLEGPGADVYFRMSQVGEARFCKIIIFPKNLLGISLWPQMTNSKKTPRNFDAACFCATHFQKKVIVAICFYSIFTSHKKIPDSQENWSLRFSCR